MSGLSSFAISFCTVCVTFSALSILLPENKLKKSLLYMLCIAFLCSILTSAKLISIKTPENKSKPTQADDTSLGMYRTAAEQTFKTALDTAGINYTDLSVLVDKNQNGSISIIEVTVYSSESEQKIEQALNRDARVVNE